MLKIWHWFIPYCSFNVVMVYGFNWEGDDPIDQSVIKRSEQSPGFLHDTRVSMNSNAVDVLHDTASLGIYALAVLRSNFMWFCVYIVWWSIRINHQIYNDIMQ